MRGQIVEVVPNGAYLFGIYSDPVVHCQFEGDGIDETVNYDNGPIFTALSM